jgi:1,4-dihydroxy-2-naphthoate octaprenyltransferase
MNGYIRVARIKFLVLPLSLILVSTSVSLYNGNLNVYNTVLGSIALILLHIAVNALNDAYDYKYGIDQNTEKTPFSGGSGAIIDGDLSFEQARNFGILNILLCIPIAIFFLIKFGVSILPFIILGLVLVTNIFARYNLGEVSAGLGLGSLPVIALGFIQQGNIEIEMIFASIFPFYLTFNLLLLNEYPDFEADKKGGRKNLIISTGKKTAGKFYIMCSILVYITILLSVILGIFPKTTLLTFLTIPLVVRPISYCLNPIDEIKERDLSYNIMWVILTNIIFSFSVLISILI